MVQQVAVGDPVFDGFSAGPYHFLVRREDDGLTAELHKEIVQDVFAVLGIDPGEGSIYNVGNGDFVQTGQCLVKSHDEDLLLTGTEFLLYYYGKDQLLVQYGTVIENFEGDSKDLAELNIKLGCLCAMLDQWKKAAEIFRTALEQDPENTQGWLMLTEACYNGEDYPGAAEALHTYSTLEPMNGEQWVTLVSLDMANEDYANAVDSCTKTLENGDCDRADLYFMRSKANYFLKNFEAARADADASIAAGGDYTENMTLKAATYEQDGDYAGILNVLLEMIDHGDADISVYQNALQCAYTTENCPAQIKILKLLLEYDADAETRQLLVKSLATAQFQTGDYDGAEESFTECVEAEPESAELLYLRGLCRMNNGKYKEAEADFSAVIELDQMIDQSMYNRAVCRLSTGNTSGASADLLAIVTRNQDEKIVALANQLLGQE